MRKVERWIELEVIIDNGSAFLTYKKIKETKSSRKEYSFPAEVPLIKLIRVARDSSKMSALMPQEHQIKVRSDKREKTHLRKFVHRSWYIKANKLYGSPSKIQSQEVEQRGSWTM